jgi:thymidylate synthase (FAD)
MTKLKPIKDVSDLDSIHGYDFSRASKYLVLIPSNYEKAEIVNQTLLLQLENLRVLIKDNIPNDIAKYAIPDCYKTQIVTTINGRSLQNFLKLRSSKSALWEIRLLARNIFNSLPEDHKYLYEHLMDKSPIKYVD